jgi:hypothetical protein
MNIEQAKIKNFDVFVDNLKLAFARDRQILESHRSDFYFGGSGSEYLFEHKTGHFFYLVLLTKKELAKGDFDFDPEDGDVLIFSMPIVSFQPELSEETTHLDFKEFNDQLHQLQKKVETKIGRIGNMYLCIHYDHDMCSLNLDRDWLNVRDFNKITREIIEGVKLYPKIISTLQKLSEEE